LGRRVSEQLKRKDQNEETAIIERAQAVDAIGPSLRAITRCRAAAATLPSNITVGKLLQES